MSSYNLTSKDIETVRIALDRYLDHVKEQIERHDKYLEDEYDPFHENTLEEKKDIEEVLQKVRQFREDELLYINEDVMLQKYRNEIEENALSSAEIQTALDLYLLQSKQKEKTPEDKISQVLEKALKTSQIKERIELSREDMKETIKELKKNQRPRQTAL